MKQGYLVPILIVAVFFGGCVTPYRVTERLDFSSTVESLEITGYNGSVSWYAIPEGSKPYIDVEITVRGSITAAVKSYAENLEIQTIQSAQSLNVHTRPVDTLPIGISNVSVRYRVYAPVENLVAFTATTSNGSIWIESFDGSLDVTTSNGSVTIENGVGRINVHTPNGRVDLGRVSLTHDSSIRTSNGRISGHVDLYPSRDYTFMTSNGRIDLSLSRYTQGEVDLRTSNGQIDIDVQGVRLKQVSPVRVTIGQQDSLIVITTSNSTIHLRDSFKW